MEPPTVNAKDWPRTMESIEEYLQQFRGTTGVPLSYVIRKKILEEVLTSSTVDNKEHTVSKQYLV